MFTPGIRATHNMGYNANAISKPEDASMLKRIIARLTVDV
jgi:hypothetical protein